MTETGLLVSMNVYNLNIKRTINFDPYASDYAESSVFLERDC